MPMCTELLEEFPLKVVDKDIDLGRAERAVLGLTMRTLENGGKHRVQNYQTFVPEDLVRTYYALARHNRTMDAVAVDRAVREVLAAIDAGRFEELAREVGV